MWSFYRPPRRPKKLFFDYLERNLPYTLGKKIIMTGDFNIDLIDKDSHDTDTFVNIMKSFGLYCTIDKSTYFSPILENPTTCLDQFWHNIAESNKSFIIYPPLADHMGCA